MTASVTPHQQHVEDATADPAREYRKPMDVLDDAGLSLQEKRKVLESWKKDAELLSTAQGENMAGGERTPLQEVSLALVELERIAGAADDRR